VTVAVFDIDGVVADVRHRVHHVAGRWKDWDAFFETADEDPLLDVGAALVHDLALQHDIVWLTGRPEWLRRTTARWLEDAGLPCESLNMRPSHDYRPARFYKLDRLKAIHAHAAGGIAAFIDDDPDVIETALAAGFAAQLAEWVPRNAEVDATLREVQERLGRT
jgi:hypothetical protein